MTEDHPESKYKHPWDEYIERLKGSAATTVVEDRYSRPCGGKNGWDDFVERWHEQASL